jgi:hypothetical protein
MMRRAIALGCLAAACTLAAPAGAAAQGFISPLLGYDYGGDSGCATRQDCDDKNSNIGVAFGHLGAFGFEAELAYARDFFGDTPDTSSNVLTFMSNLLIAPKIGPVRPYVAIGVGLIKSRVEFTGTSLLDFNNNNFGWDFGGGLMVFFGDHVGVRGELRRFRTFGDSGLIGLLPGDNEELAFNRAAAGLVLAF